MPYLVTASAYLAHYMLLAIDLALIVRALFSFIAPDSDSPLYQLSCFITEPLLALCSKILELLHLSNAGFFDMSFFLAVMITWLLDTIIEMVL